jgi:alpha-tubulin suppressor-like RCC1 family protein
MRPDGIVACWGRKPESEASSLAGAFAALSAGGGHTCGVKIDGTIVCWGDNSYGQATPPAM